MDFDLGQYLRDDLKKYYENIISRPSDTEKIREFIRIVGLWICVEVGHKNAIKGIDDFIKSLRDIVNLTEVIVEIMSKSTGFEATINGRLIRSIIHNDPDRIDFLSILQHENYGKSSGIVDVMNEIIESQI